MNLIDTQTNVRIAKCHNPHVFSDMATFTLVMFRMGYVESGLNPLLPHLKRTKKLAAAGHAKCKPDQISSRARMPFVPSGHLDTASTVQRLREEMKIR